MGAAAWAEAGEEFPWDLGMSGSPGRGRDVGFGAVCVQLLLLLRGLCSGLQIITALIPLGGRGNLLLQSVPALGLLPGLAPGDTSDGNGALSCFSAFPCR